MEEIAQVYARSLFEVAKENDKLDVVREQLGQFADDRDANRELRVFFFSPYFSSAEKKDGSGKIVENGDEHFVRFLELLAEPHRLPAIFRIRREFDRLWAEENKLLQVSVTSAVELDEEIVKQTSARRSRTRPVRRSTSDGERGPRPDRRARAAGRQHGLDATIRGRLENLEGSRRGGVRSLGDLWLNP